jgi:activator of HSP90 ATPase
MLESCESDEQPGECALNTKNGHARRTNWWLAASGLALFAGAVGAATSRGTFTQELRQNMEAIHQEVYLDAPPERVYAALTDGKQFQQVVLLSGAVQSGMVKAAQAAHIASEVGGAFAIFGGFVTGRQIELVKDVRIVQAWRPGDWPAGVYSIARFDLQKQGSGTLLVFDHTGFPAGAGEHLAEGWKMNYWQPLAKFLESAPRKVQ